MKDIEKNISSLIQSQFPSFYSEEGEQFITFVKAYYEWLESENNPLYHSRRLFEYADIDKTLEQFIINFKEKYLKNIVFTTDSNKRLFIKHALEFYKAKGSERAVDLFFRLIYGVPAQIYTPGDDLFRLSASTYSKPLYLEVTKEAKNINFVGKQITGALSGATAFVEKLIRKKINIQTIDVFYISNIKKDFMIHEVITFDDDFDNSPRVIGSLTNFEVIAGGSDFGVGDIVSIDSTVTGAQAKAIVSEVNNVTGLVDFTLEDGGWGFSSNAQVIVSEKVLVVNNVKMANTSVPNTFFLFETVKQPLANITFNDLIGGGFAINDIIDKKYSNGTLAANGRVLALTQNTTTKTGELFLSIISGNAQLGNTTITKHGSAISANSITITDKTATANVMGVSSNVVLYVSDIHGTYQKGEEIYQSNATVEWANGIVQSVSGTSISVTGVRGIFRTKTLDANLITGRTSFASSTLDSFSTTIGVHQISDINIFTNLQGNYIIADDPAAVIIIPDTTGGLNFSNGQALTITGITSATANMNGTAKTYANSCLASIRITSGGPGYLDGENVTINSSTSTANATGEIIIIPGSSTSANIALIGEGSLAGFSVANLSYEETTVVNEDLIISKNYANVKFIDTGFIVDGSSGTGVSSNGYGFIKNPAGNINSIILDCLRIESRSVGTITNITGINKGTNYNIDPFVLVYEPAIAAQGANDYFFTIENSTGNFAQGELIKQTREIANVNVITVSNVTSGNIEYLSVSDVNLTFTLGEDIFQSDGTANLGFGKLTGVVVTDGTGTLTVSSVSNAFNSALPYRIKGATSSANAQLDLVDHRPFTVGELLNQSNGTANVANGIVESSAITWNFTTNRGSGTIVLTGVGTNLVVSNTTSLRLFGTLTTSNAYINTVNTSNVTLTTKGIIREVVNDSTLNVKRLSLGNFFEVSSNSVVIGISSSTSANLTAINYDDTRSGLNANVSADVVIANGHVVSLNLLNSGFGYSNGQVINFYSEDGERAGTTKLILEKQGTGEGYFHDQKGFLSHNSHMFDGKFYQEYSYQVMSRLPFEKYSDMFKKVLHIAGTEFFGKVVLEENVNNSIAYANVKMKTSNLVFKNVTNTEVITPDYYVYQSNGTAITANGYVSEYPSATILTTNTTHLFEIGQKITQPDLATNAASGFLIGLQSNASHTYLYLANTRGTFATATSLRGVWQRTATVTPIQTATITNIVKPDKNTESFIVGQTVYTGSVGTETFIGTVISANSSIVRLTKTSGTLPVSGLLSSTTTSTTAIIKSITSSTFTVGTKAYQEIKNISLRDIKNADSTTKSFAVNENVYQYKLNPIVSSDIYNVNIAEGKVIFANSTMIKVAKVFGSFANNSEIRGSTDGRYATINNIGSQIIATGNVVYSDATTLVVKTVTGTFTTDNYIYGSNAFANVTAITSNSVTIPSTNVVSAINTLIVANTKGTFSGNSTSNGIVVLYPDNTTAATANLTAVKIESL